MLFGHFKRCAFITLLGCAAAAWPLAARAQQGGRGPTIGFLGSDASGWGPWTTTFARRLRELGWIEGRTIGIEYRWPEARPTRVVRLNVDVIVTMGSAVLSSD